MAPRRFPHGFAWGVATASYQNEGAVHEGGRSPSIWDSFSHTPGKIADGGTGDVACDHYHRYREDVELLAELSVTHYRFSLAWPRLQPDGRGALNPAGLDFYVRLVDALLERGIQPWVTLYHWDLPQVLQDEGGWPERDTALRFADYAAAVHERLQDRIQVWTTLNEPWCSSLVGHAAGDHAPGIQDPGLALRAAHHLLLGHGLAIEAMRSQADDRSRFGVTVNLQPVSPAGDDPKDRDAARRIDLIANRMFVDPLLRGGYPADFADHATRFTDLSHVAPGDEAIIAAPLDLLGINYYFGVVVRSGERKGGPSPWVGCEDVEFVSRGLPRTQTDWEIDPDGLHDLLVRVAREYPGAPPLYLTENGVALADRPPTDGVVDDPARIEYLDAHFRAAHRAIGEGVDLRGYFVWTLMDNFEWRFGYTKTFGLYQVDFETQRRTPKASARWFAEVIRRNGPA